MPEEIITTEQTETTSVSSILNYRAITKEAIYPTRSMGMGKILIEIVDVYLLTYECSYYGRKNPRGNYQEGDYDTLDLKGNLVKIIDFD